MNTKLEHKFYSDCRCRGKQWRKGVATPNADKSGQVRGGVNFTYVDVCYGRALVKGERYVLLSRV